MGQRKTETLLPDDVIECVEDARRAGMEVSTIDDLDHTQYDTDREVKNARLTRHPSIVARCRNAADVAFWFRCANTHRGFDTMRFVVRSGGHQHEGRSTDDSAIVLDLSAIADIDIDTAHTRAILGSGAPLGQVEERLCAIGKVIPIGLCESVNAGGLAHGGGWGLSWRRHGMTIDTLVDVEIVTSEGRVIDSAAATDPDLLRAVRGGGGGNFGVVTKLHFDLSDRDPEAQPFSLAWDKDVRTKVTMKWIEMMATADDRFNSFCRFGLPGSVSEALRISGVYYGSEQECNDVLAELEAVAPPIKRRCFTAANDADLYALFTGQDKGLDLLTARGVDEPVQTFALHMSPLGDFGPPSTCTGAHRHKVTSAFPDDSSAADLIDAIDKYLRTTHTINNANLYVTLHGMGGRGGDQNEDTTYPWRDQVFLVQGQAWWNLEKIDHACEAFIDGLRLAMAPWTKGAFISFPDEAQNKRLYYGDNFDELREIKRTYDPGDRLKYKLGLTWQDELRPPPLA